MNDAVFFDHNAYVKIKMVDVSIDKADAFMKNDSLVNFKEKQDIR